MIIIKVLLVSHGYLAKEMLATAKMIYGDINNMDYLELPYGCDLEDYKRQIIKKVEEADNKLLILADLFGGSPFMLTSQVLSSADYVDKVEVVTGMNLGMVLEVANQINNNSSVDINSLKKLAVGTGIEGICDLKEKIGE